MTVPAATAAIRVQAANALLREPVNVVAARVAGLTAMLADDKKGAGRLLAYADSLSRRDLGTQVALIEMAVARGDIAAALRHYDVALRTGDTADQLLMPVLVTASRDPAIATALGTMLARRPPWRLRFVYSLVTARPWAPTFLPLIEAARLDVNNPIERDFLARTATGLVAAGAITDAAGLYARATGTPVTGDVRNGLFAAEDRITPFDWELTDEPGLGASKGRVDGTSLAAALSINADAGRSGVVARQLLLLRPQRYRLRFTVGDVADTDRSGVSLTCNGTDIGIASIRFPVTARPRIVETIVDVPANCPGQWLKVEAGTDIDASMAAVAAPWISDIAVIR